MATTQEIIDAATKLGELIHQHESAQKFNAAVEAIEKDDDAKRLLNDYNRMMEAVMTKQQTGQPIEVDEKHQLEELQAQVIANDVLKNLQVAEMDYADLRRKVGAAIQGQPQEPTEKASPIITE